MLTLTIATDATSHNHFEDALRVNGGATIAPVVGRDAVAPHDLAATALNQTADRASTIHPNAAGLLDSGTADLPWPDQHTLERLRDNIIHAARTGTIIWYVAFILWGITEP